MKKPRGPATPFLVVANLLVFGVLLYAWILEDSAPAFYYSSLQEDAYLEWATFWGFLAAGALFFWAALRERRQLSRLPWFLCGVGLFCVVVAMEEISWGQRVLAYRPPVYFLENNFQQELNLHNVISTSLRKLALKASILGYGVFLPLVAVVRPGRRLLARIGVNAPPLGLLPAFAASFLLYQIYPWKFSGEVVELMLGLAFLGAALFEYLRLGDDASRRGVRAAAPIALGGAVILLLGLGTQAFSRLAIGDDSERVEAAQREVEHLKIDFLTAGRRANGTASRCGVHKRVYTFVEKYRAAGLRDGRFSRLTGKGMPEERAAFFLDPWNSPYWIRDECSRRQGRREIFVYSFGPNRRRDSSEWELKGDDVGAIILSSGPRRGASEAD